MSQDGHDSIDDADGINEVGLVAPEDRGKYKKFHKSFSKWLVKASCSSSWVWAKKYGSWSGLKKADTSVQLEIATQFFWGVEDP